MNVSAARHYVGPLHVWNLARYLHNRSTLGHFVAWEVLPPEAHDAYLSEARRIAAALIGDVASTVRQFEATPA